MIKFLKDFWNWLHYDLLYPDAVYCSKCGACGVEDCCSNVCQGGLFCKYREYYKEQAELDKLYGTLSCLNCSMNLGVTYRDLEYGFCYCSHCGYSNEFTDPRVKVIEGV